MKIQIKKTADKIIGGLRVPPEVFEKISILAKREKVSNQEIVRAILTRVIDEVE